MNMFLFGRCKSLIKSCLEHTVHLHFVPFMKAFIVPMGGTHCPKL